MADFVHLHLHTLYSLLDGAIRMKDLIATIKAKGMTSVAVTDHGNMFGAVDFYKQAKDAGIKPILGYEAYVAGPKGRKDRSERVSHHMILLAKDQEGWANLRYLASMGFMEGHYYHPRIDKQLLKERNKGIIGLTACLGGEIPGLAMRGDLDGARAAALELKQIFEPGSLFFELQSNGMAEQDRANAALKQLSRDLDVPLAATADSHYVKQEDAEAHELLMCIAQGKTLDDPKRLKQHTDQLYIKSPEEMLAHFSDVPEAVHNTVRIAELCNVEMQLGKSFLPNFTVPEGYDQPQYLAHLARTGLDRRFNELKYPLDRDEYRKRLELEIAVINQMGFAGYFLIVQDFINWAKSHRIPVGPGRGSGAGSLVAYALRITDLDPLPYALLFERFLNPDRVSMPDFDVDFCQARRGEVITYVTDKYGRNNVGQIITFGQLSAKSAIKDVGRVMGLSFAESNELTKEIPNLIDGHAPTIEKSLEIAPKLKEKIDADPKIAKLVKIAQALEGLNRQAGMHAAGVVISDKPLWEYVPVYVPAGESFLVTQYAKDEVEKAGLVKFDFLGLKTLTVIDEAIRMVNANAVAGTPEIAADQIPLDDVEVYKLISRGETKGIFQLESQGFTELLMKLKPTRFEDIVAAVALYRPGPLETGMVKDFVECKHGRQAVSYPHPSLEQILEPTYGVIVYQEQVMQIAQVMGGYSLGRADLLRRAMGKKKKEEMEKERGSFEEGARAKGIPPKLAEDIFNLMEKFAGYGFNKSHSAAYAVLTIQTAWLKAHHPAEFMAALLTSEADDTDKIVLHVADARQMKLQVQGVDVNESRAGFHGLARVIRFGLGGVKGVGGQAVDAILEARKEGPFAGVHELCERCDSRRVNKKVVEALVKAGAFDFTGHPRHSMFASIEGAFERGQGAQRDRASGQASLFGMLAGAATGKPARPAPGRDGPYPPGEPWTEKERLAAERETLGFYLSGHPLAPYEEEIRKLATHTTAKLHERGKPREKVKLVAVVAAFRTRPSKTSGKLMGFLTLEDATGSIEAVAFTGGRRADPRSGEPGREGGLELWQPLLETDAPLLFTASVRMDERDPEHPKVELILDDVVPLAQARARSATKFVVRAGTELFNDERLNKLRELFVKHPGPLVVEVQVVDPGQTVSRLMLRSTRVTASDELKERIELLFGSQVTSVA